MIRSIIELLEYANGETETIRIAQGKYKIPLSFKDVKRKIKMKK